MSDVNRTKRNRKESSHKRQIKRAKSLEQDGQTAAAVDQYKEAAEVAVERAEINRSEEDEQYWLDKAKEDLCNASEISNKDLSLSDIDTRESHFGDSVTTGDNQSTDDNKPEFGCDDIPEVSYDEIGGLSDVKTAVQEAIEWPLMYPETFKEYDLDPPSGVLLYGPPGTGKTMLAKAIANESSAAFLHVKGPEIFGKYLGESEEAIRTVFRQARESDAERAVIFFDELDSIASKRADSSENASENRVVNQLLTELDGIETGEKQQDTELISLASTNRPDIIDTALTRPGRFGTHIHVPAPDPEARREILRVHTKKKPLAEDVNIKYIVDKTRGFSGSDLDSLARKAAMTAIRAEKARRHVSDPIEFTISMRDFEIVLEDMSPSITDDAINRCKQFAE